MTKMQLSVVLAILMLVSSYAKRTGIKAIYCAAISKDQNGTMSGTDNDLISTLVEKTLIPIGYTKTDSSPGGSIFILRGRSSSTTAYSQSTVIVTNSMGVTSTGRRNACC